MKMEVRIPKNGCPMVESIPWTDEKVRAFCNKGCSVICAEEIKNKLEKQGYKVTVESDGLKQIDGKKKAKKYDANEKMKKWLEGLRNV